MAKPLTLRAKADADIDAAIAWYRSAAPPQVNRFIDSLESLFAQIERHPSAGSPRFAVELSMPALRYRLVKDFPYVVFYLDLDEEVAVIRVLHQRRDIPELLKLD